MKYKLLLLSSSFFFSLGYILGSQAQNWVESAEQKFQAQDYKEAEKMIQKAIESDKKNHELIAKRGLYRLLQKKYSKALADFNQASKLSPQTALYFQYKGVVKDSMKKHLEATFEFTKATRYAPNDALLYYLRGRAKLKMRDMQGAVADFNKALALNSQYAEAYAYRGYVKLKMIDREGACQDWKTAQNLGYTHMQNYLEKYCKE